MRRAENRDYGQKIDYDPQWKGPLEIERKQTDFGFLIALIVYFAVWISVGIYAFCTGDMEWILHEIHLDFSSDILTIVYISLGFTVLGICLSFAYLILLRYFTKVVVFSSCFIILVSLLAIIAGLMIYLIGESEEHPDTIREIQGVLLIVSVFAFIIIATCYIICIIACHKEILIACGVIKESTKAVMFFPSSFVFPILPFILSELVVAFAAVTAIFLHENSSVPSENRHIYLDVLNGINIFGSLWMLGFLNAFSEMVLSGTFATWYWTMDKNRIPSCTMFKFMHITTRFHLGSLAFGSLIIAIVQAIRALLKWLLRRSLESSDYVSTAILFCFECLCDVTEDVLDWMNSNAYIMCTIHGTSFLQSAKNAFNLLMRNITSVIVVNNVTSTIILLGGFLVVGFSVLGTYALCRNMEDDAKYLAMTAVLVSTLMMSFAILGVLQTAVGTIFLCVLEDYERNNGSRERPYFMSDELKQLLIRDV